jgi:hypothetical protein
LLGGVGGVGGPGPGGPGGPSHGYAPGSAHAGPWDYRDKENDAHARERTDRCEAVTRLINTHTHKHTHTHTHTNARTHARTHTHTHTHTRTRTRTRTHQQQTCQHHPDHSSPTWQSCFVHTSHAARGGVDLAAHAHLTLQYADLFPWSISALQCILFDHHSCAGGGAHPNPKPAITCGRPAVRANPISVQINQCCNVVRNRSTTSVKLNTHVLFLMASNSMLGECLSLSVSSRERKCGMQGCSTFTHTHIHTHTHTHAHAHTHTIAELAHDHALKSSLAILR